MRRAEIAQLAGLLGGDNLDQRSVSRELPRPASAETSTIRSRRSLAWDHRRSSRSSSSSRPTSGVSAVRKAANRLSTPLADDAPGSWVAGKALQHLRSEILHLE